jgi:hypothetical protein
VKSIQSAGGFHQRPTIKVRLLAATTILHPAHFGIQMSTARFISIYKKVATWLKQIKEDSSQGGGGGCYSQTGGILFAPENAITRIEIFGPSKWPIKKQHIFDDILPRQKKMLEIYGHP